MKIAEKYIKFDLIENIGVPSLKPISIYIMEFGDALNILVLRLLNTL